MGDGGRDIIENPTYTYLNNEGIVVCLATRKGDCWSESCDSNVFRFRGSTSIFSLQGIQVSPNPTRGKLTISLSNDKLMESIEVIDLQGKAVISQEFTSNQNAIKLNLAEQKQGVYFVRVYSEGLVGTKCIVIER
jgi:hypothetical protein